MDQRVSQLFFCQLSRIRPTAVILSGSNWLSFCFDRSSGYLVIIGIDHRKHLDQVEQRNEDTRTRMHRYTFPRAYACIRSISQSSGRGTSANRRFIAEYIKVV